MDYTITHNDNGTITISAIHKEQRVHRLYSGYTEKQAEDRFVKYLKELE